MPKRKKAKKAKETAEELPPVEEPEAPKPQKAKLEPLKAKVNNFVYKTPREVRWFLSRVYVNFM